MKKGWDLDEKGKRSTWRCHKIEIKRAWDLDEKKIFSWEFEIFTKRY